MKRLLIPLASAALLAFGSVIPALGSSPDTGVARVTYYTDTGYMADGNYTHPGAAGCAPWNMGAVVYFPEVDVSVVCEDTGDPSWFVDGQMKIDISAPAGRPWFLQGRDYLTYVITGCAFTTDTGGICG